MYSEQNSLPIETGANFFEFIGMELIPYIEKTYRAEILEWPLVMEKQPILLITIY